MAISLRQARWLLLPHEFAFRCLFYWTREACCAVFRGGSSTPRGIGGACVRGSKWRCPLRTLALVVHLMNTICNIQSQTTPIGYRLRTVALAICSRRCGRGCTYHTAQSRGCSLSSTNLQSGGPGLHIEANLWCPPVHGGAETRSAQCSGRRPCPAGVRPMRHPKPSGAPKLISQVSQPATPACAQRLSPARPDPAPGSMLLSSAGHRGRAAPAGRQRAETPPAGPPGMGTEG